jgi:hypothetical protein
VLVVYIVDYCDQLRNMISVILGPFTIIHSIIASVMNYYNYQVIFLTNTRLPVYKTMNTGMRTKALNDLVRLLVPRKCGVYK